MTPCTLSCRYLHRPDDILKFLMVDTGIYFEDRDERHMPFLIAASPHFVIIVNLEICRPHSPCYYYYYYSGIRDTESGLIF
jgi:hypothetical protein